MSRVSRSVFVLVSIVLLSIWAAGCGDDGPAGPAPPTTGTVIVDRAPDTLACTWQLEGPSGYSHSGTNGETIAKLDPGDYTLTWGAVEGWTPPDPVSETLALAAGKTVTFNGTYTVIQAETVSTPNAPGGPTAGFESQDLTYSASGSVNNLGHAVEYRFDWGDDTFSDWGTAAVQNSWTTAGTYDVKAQARCIAHPATESAWSAATSVTITEYVAETISTPDTPTGSTNVQVDQSSSYSTSGAVSSYGDDVQYRFDWGDGNLSTWSNSSTTSHSWTAEGTYDVRAQARCAVHQTIMSDWSSASAVTVTAAAGETVSTPDAPSGPASGETGEDLTYAASGAVSSLGHAVEYRFDFGDGTVTGWLYGLTSLPHSWSTAGTYNVTVQARCRTHTDIESAWSAPTVVEISEPAEHIPSPPGAINGVTEGQIDDPYEYIVYHSSQTNLGDPVEGRFDWGDGSYSDWIAAPPYSATHAWTVEGTYTVKYEARCSVHNDITASADSLVTTITTTAVETISKPGYINYSYSLRNPEINIERMYLASGGLSSLGHSLEVMIDWGDGTQSAWVPNGTYVPKTWTTAGTYELRRQARCSIHTEVVSEWSDPTYINALEPETVSTPHAPSGTTTGHKYENLSYSTSGSTSNWHDTYIEYRFDWGDGSALSEWSTDTTRTHQFTVLGAYEVRAQARCSFPGHGEPVSEWSPPTTVSIVMEVTILQYAPRGPYYAAVGDSHTFEAYYSASSDGGCTEFEYQFDWDDGTYSEWSTSMSADHAFTATGTYYVRYRARCAAVPEAVSDWSSQARSVEVTDAPESVATPDRPTTSSPPIDVGEQISISISGSYSNHGHPIEYQFDFGDGTQSDWIAGTPWSSFYQASTQHTYTSIGSYDITCKARSAVNPAVESALSEPRTIDVLEVIETPPAPTGPATGVTGANLTFTTAGTTSSEGHALEYSFEYRNGYSAFYTSDWSSSLSDDHVFTSAGSFNVRVRARCATDTGAMSYYSQVFNFTITDTQ